MTQDSPGKGPSRAPGRPVTLRRKLAPTLSHPVALRPSFGSADGSIPRTRHAVITLGYTLADRAAQSFGVPELFQYRYQDRLGRFNKPCLYHHVAEGEPFYDLEWAEKTHEESEHLFEAGPFVNRGRAFAISRSSDATNGNEYLFDSHEIVYAPFVEYDREMVYEIRRAINALIADPEYYRRIALIRHDAMRDAR